MNSRILLSLLLTTAALADQPVLTLESISSRVRTANPDLAAARLRIAEARGRLTQSGRLANPELEFDFARNTIGREGALGLSLMQRFPLTARLRHEKAVSRAQLAAAEAEVREVERKLIAQAQTDAVKLLAVKNQRGLRAKQLAASKDLSGFLQKRVEAGEASTIETALIDLESRQIEVQQLQLAAEEAALIGELRPLIGLSGAERIAIDGELFAPVSAPALASGASARPDLQAAQHTAEAARADLAKERASRFEDIGIGAMWSRETTKDEPEPTDIEHILGFQVSIPLPLWNRNQGRIAEAAATVERTRREAEALALNATAEANAARGEMAALQSLLGELDGKLLPKAAEIEERLRQTYATGQTPLLEVLRARTRSLELQQQRLDALRDYHLARVRHAAALGRPVK